MTTYTEQQLLDLLHVFYSDYGRTPTQREVIADPRLPIHHTYRNRFGSLANAVEKAGLTDLPETYVQLHKLVGGWLKERGFDFYEYMATSAVGNDFVHFDFLVITHRGTVAIDIFDVERIRPTVLAHRLELINLSGHRVLTINKLEDITLLQQL